MKTKALKTKALISFAVTTKLICAFVFAYAKCWFSQVLLILTFVLIQFAGNDLGHGFYGYYIKLLLNQVGYLLGNRLMISGYSP